MKHKAKLLFALGLLILINHAAIAQPQNDYSLQFKIDIEKKISRSLSTSVFYQNAFNQNASELFYNIIDGGFDYKISRHFSLDARYRFVTIRNLENFYNNRNMIYTDITYTKGIARFGIMARGRLQRQFYGSMNNENLISYRDYCRTKLQLKYKINYYLSPYISAEMHFPINNPLRKTFDQWRQTAGIVYTLNNKLKFEFFLQSQELTARKNKKNNYITAFNVYYKL